MTSQFTKIRLLATLTAALALSGCAVGPDYLRPDAWLPDMFRSKPAAETPVARAENPAVNAEWWRLFNDPALDALVQQALAANQDLAAAAARLEAADAAAREAGADFLPRLDLGAGSTQSQTSGDTFNGRRVGQATYGNRRVAASASYELDVWGRIRRSNEAARADALASRYARDSVRLTLLCQLTGEYLTLRSLDAQQAVADDTLASREKSLKIVLARVEAGAGSPLDQAQAESALAAAQAQVAQLRRQRSLSESLIGLLAGQPGLSIPTGKLDTLPLPPLPPAGLPSDLLDARPDIRQAEEKLVAANARIGVAKSAYFPSISLTGNIGSESLALAGLFGSNAGFWSAAVNLAMPIFDAGRTGARVDQASAAQKEALATYRKTVQTAFREVNDALVSLRELGEEEAATRNQATAAKRTLSLAQARYEAGYVAYLEVLDAQRTANSAQLSLLSVQRNRLAAAVDLFKALGGGWRAER